MGSTKTYKTIQTMEYRGHVYRANRIITFQPKNAKRFLGEGKIIEVDDSRPTNVLTAGIHLPHELVLLGSGPNANAHIPALKRSGKYIVALNHAIWQPVDAAIWAAQDPTLKDQEGFYRKANELRDTGRKFGLREFQRGDRPMPFFDKKKVQKYFPWFKLVFDVNKPGIDAKTFSYFPIGRDKLRVYQGATICGTFMQVAIRLGVKRIILCGIDMYGHIYFDGSQHRKAQRKGQIWTSSGALDFLIKRAWDIGVEVYTISDTQLKNAKRMELDNDGAQTSGETQDNSAAGGGGDQDLPMREVSANSEVERSGKAV